MGASRGEGKANLKLLEYLFLTCQDGLLHRVIYSLPVFALLLTPTPADGQTFLVSFGDTLYSKANGALRTSAQPGSEVIERLELGDTLVVRDAKTVNGTSQWKVETKVGMGWLVKGFMLSEKQYLKRKKEGEGLSASEQDTVVVDASMTYIWEEAERYSDTIGKLSSGDRLALVYVKVDWARVKRNNVEGFVPVDNLVSLVEYRREQREKRDRRRKALERKKQRLKQKRRAERRRQQRLEALRDQGVLMTLDAQGFDKNSADGIASSFRISNISEDKTVKYARLTLRLFNPVGDATPGEHSPATQTVRAVGPIEPGDEGYYDFENTWYSSTGSCVELRSVLVQYVDGSSSEYADNLDLVRKEGSGVNLAGDCSYEAQSN